MTAEPGPLNEAEFEVLASLLRRFAEHDLDQWAAWRCDTSCGGVYIYVGRQLLEGHTGSEYDAIP